MFGLFGAILYAPPSQPAAVEPVLRTFRQPDGKEFIGWVLGDEFVVFYETAEGFSIAQNAAGFWCYARLGADGRLEASEYLVGEAIPDAVIAEKHRRHAPHVMQDLQQRREAHYENLRLLAPGPAKPVGDLRLAKRAVNHYRLAVLLVEFPDTPASYAPADFEQMLFSEGYTYVSPAPGEPAFGSLRDYYLAMSNGMLSVTGQAFNWVQADSNKSYYERHGNLRFEALNKSGVSLADFDGYVVIYAGTVGPSGSNLWPQAFSTGGKLHYVMSEKWLSRYEFAPIGVHCHEFGHLLGLPDLYDTDFSSPGAGRWCTMSTGNYGSGFHERPHHLCAWAKSTLGWLVPQTFYEGTAVPAVLPPVATARAAAKLISMASYFLLENRQQLDYDLNLPGDGLLIWHVDERYGSQSIDSHRLVDLEEADRTETGGDGGDPFPGTSQNSTFGAATLPASTDYDGHSYVNVSNIRVQGQDIYCELSVNLGPGAGITLNQKGNFPTIFTAMEAAFPHGEVYLPRGLYYESDLRLKEGVRVRGEQAAATIIDGQGRRLIEMRNISSGEIRDLSMVNGSTGIFVLRSQVDISYTVIAGMSVDGIVAFETAAHLRNNTIINVAAAGLSCLAGATPQVRNNIFAHNTTGIAKLESAQPELFYNDVWNNAINYQGLAAGGSDLSRDPLFINPFFGDFRLRAESPCINAGDPDSAFTDPDGTRSDIGALPFAFTPPPAPGEFRVNCGGETYRAPDSSVWLHDQPYLPGGAGFVGGVADSTNDPIAHTEMAELYQTVRRGLSAYRLDVPNGRYRVRLHFAEIEFEAPHQRRFDVAIENQLFLQDFDIYALVGHDFALVEETLAPVEDGQLNISFTPRREEPVLAGLEVQPINPLFIDIAAFAKAADPGAGVGAALGDYDGDGSLDIFVANAQKTSTLLQNNGLATFINQTQAAGLQAAESAEAGVWGDYDNDGRLDLYVVRSEKPGLLYHNLGTGRFAEGAATAGVTNERAGRSAVWSDFDRDGHLDLFVANAGVSRLYRNIGNGSFEDLAPAAGVGDPLSSTGALGGDFNHDGFPDLLVTQLYHTFSSPNMLYLNNRDFTFTAATLGQNGLGATAGDYDNDGDLDIFMISMLNPLGAGEHLLLRNEGNGHFTDVADSAGLRAELPGQSAAWGDFDNDGWLDLHLAGPSQSRQIMRNLGNGKFSDFSQAAGVPALPFARANVSGDLDHDGDAEIYVVNQNQPNRLYQNLCRGNNWLVIKLEGRRSNRAAIGSRVRLRAGELALWREVSGGSGFRSQESLALEVGLGNHEQVDTLAVFWASGLVESFTAVRGVNRYLTIVEGVTVQADTHTDHTALPARFSLSQNFPNPIWGGPHAGATTIQYTLARPGRVELKIFNLLGQEVRVLAHGLQSAGRHTASWDGRDAAGIPVNSGIYFYQLDTDQSRSRKKMLVLMRSQ
ncbi:MAG: hypothetical protein DKINENOH_03953 [bacterium]|nr:hypothetical protein [bacterium]